MLAQSPSGLFVGDVFICLHSLLPNAPVHLKIEGYSAGGSIKTKTAWNMIDRLDARGLLGQGTRLIESSSGNLGLALSIIAAERGYSFTCVSDPNLSQHIRKLMAAHGANVIIIDKRDENGGYLGSRIAYINARLQEDPNLIWLNQYANPDNAGAHMRFTGPEIATAFPKVDFLFVGAGTTGTLNGVSQYFRTHSPQTRIIAADSVGSVTFGTPPATRHIPGLGTSRPPAIADDQAMDELEVVPEADTILMCRYIAAQGLLVGGSTGTVLAAVCRWRWRIPTGATVVAIAPDLGERYLDTIYDNEWVETRFAGLLDCCRAVIKSAPPLWESCHV